MKKYYINSIDEDDMKFHSLNLLFSDFVTFDNNDASEECGIRCTYYETNRFRPIIFYKQVTRSICDFSCMKVYE